MTASELRPGDRFRYVNWSNESDVYIALERRRMCGWLVQENTILPDVPMCGTFNMLKEGDVMAVHAEKWTLIGCIADQQVELTEGN